MEVCDSRAPIIAADGLHAKGLADAARNLPATQLAGIWANRAWNSTIVIEVLYNRLEISVRVVG